MDCPQIKSILEKYWEGETSLEEEGQLRNYFSQEEVAQELKIYQPMFQHFEATQSKKLSANFEDKLLKALKEEDQPVVRRMILPQWFKVAAMILVCFGMYHFMLNQSPIENKAIVWEDTYENPEEAYEETLLALKLLSQKLNKGKKETSKGLLKMKNSTRKINH